MSANPTALRLSRPRALTVPWGQVVASAVYLVVVFGPVAWLTIQATGRLVVQPALLTRAFSAERLPLLLRSAGLALGVAAGGMLVGTLVAVALWRWRGGRWASLRWLVLVLAPVPAYVHALAWSSSLARIDRILTAHGWAGPPTSGPWIAGFVQAMALLPLAVALGILALDAVGTDLVEAARLCRGDLVVLWRVALPLAAPLILAGGGVLLVLSLLDYSVPALFQVNVYALAVFADYSTTNDPITAFAMAIPLIALAVVIVVLVQGRLRRAAQRPPHHRPAQAAALAWSRWFGAVLGVAMLVMAAQVLVPLVRLAADVGSVDVLASTVSAARREVAFSLGVALAAAALCLPLAVAAGLQLQRGDAVGRMWWLLVTLPLAVPASLVGIGLISLWNRPAFGGIYGSAAMPVLAALVRFVPLAALAVLAQSRRIDPLLIDAARVHQTSGRQTWWRVRLPLLVPGLVAAAALAFALTLGELGATLIVAPPGDQTLTMRIYNYMHYGASDAVAGLCLAMAAAAVLAGLVTLIALGGWARVSGRAGSVEEAP